MSRCPHLASNEYPPTALIKLRANGIPAFANRLAIDHGDPHNAEMTGQESRRTESHQRTEPERKPIHLLWQVS